MHPPILRPESRARVCCTLLRDEQLSTCDACAKMRTDAQRPCDAQTNASLRLRISMEALLHSHDAKIIVLA